MRIKFLETCQSDVPHMPFQAGQIVTLSSVDVPVAFRSYVKRGQAIILTEDVTERAVEPEMEQPEAPKVKGRTRVERLDK